ncbi:MAG: hypothetical protein KZQ81_19330, partial [Candidatus Thiodiazotropha sp. (ex Rostrolucina anterorostrata)]|nr:hypothetical protein [Candidatus Thiodiazotropha sp. (ex Rostrolucina anterorostrata)]
MLNQRRRHPAATSSGGPGFTVVSCRGDLAGKNREARKTRTLFTTKSAPWPWFLTRTSDCRIYQNLDTPTIIKEIVSKIGQEVIVDFLDGDPDRPIISGRVYNAEQMPPWALPANQTQSGM